MTQFDRVKFVNDANERKYSNVSTNKIAINVRGAIVYSIGGFAYLFCNDNAEVFRNFLVIRVEGRTV